MAGMKVGASFGSFWPFHGRVYFLRELAWRHVLLSGFLFTAAHALLDPLPDLRGALLPEGSLRRDVALALIRLDRALAPALAPLAGDRARARVFEAELVAALLGSCLAHRLFAPSGVEAH